MALSASAPPTGMMIDPTKQGEYPILLGDKLARKGGADATTFINITYNHKSKSATAHQRTKITRSPISQDIYNLAITDKAGNAEQTTLEYKYRGSIDPSMPVQGSEARNLVLIFDPNRKAFILEPVNASLHFNLRSAPGKNKELIEQYEQLHTLGDDGDHTSRDESDDEKPEDAEQDNPYDFRHFLPKPDVEKAKPIMSTTTTPDPHNVVSRAATPTMPPTKAQKAKPSAPPRPKQQTNPLRQPKRAPKASPAIKASTTKTKPQPKSAPRVDPEDDISISGLGQSDGEEHEQRQQKSSQAMASPSSNIIVEEGGIIIDMGSPPTRPIFQVDPTHFSSSNNSVNGTDEDENEREEDDDDDEEIEALRLPSPARQNVAASARSLTPPAREHNDEDEDEDEDEDALAAEMEAAFEEEASRTQSLQQAQRYVPSDEESEVSEEE